VHAPTSIYNCIFVSIYISLYSRFTAHTLAVKTLAWSPHQNGLIASGRGGGTVHAPTYMYNYISVSIYISLYIRFTAHTLAVKALAWSPHQNGLIASGRGRC